MTLQDIARITHGVNCVEGREGKKPIDQAEAKGTNHGLEFRAGVFAERFLEDCSGIERNNVDSCHVLASQ